jgi:hypothetical protein
MNSSARFQLLLSFIISAFSTLIVAQNNTVFYDVSLQTSLASQKTLPFYMVRNTYGTQPNSDNLLLQTAIFSNFSKPEADWDFAFKGAVSGYLADENNALVNELYASVKYKNWIFTAGAKHDALKWEGLSTSNGNIIKSVNSRSFPGINLESKGFITLPFAKKWLRAKMNYAEYLLNDLRAVDNAHLHHKSLHFKSTLSNKLELITGLDHYVVWGGTSEEYGKQPSSFKDYLKLITARAGGTNSFSGEQVNALGNHVGAYLLQLNSYGVNSNWSFYWSHPFEDTSGLNLSNYPDALFGLFIDLKNPDGLVSHILGEFYYTKDQGREASTNNLIDNYFNNKLYESGWTYFGATIGSPFFITKEPVNGITQGVKLDYSRFTAYSLGLKGSISENLKYSGLISYTYYAGWFNSNLAANKLVASKIQFHYTNTALPFEISFGAAADFGNFLTDNFGGFITLRKTGNF